MDTHSGEKEPSFAHFIILGPVGSGKTSLCQQIQSLFNKRSIVYPPRYLKVAPTAGQELLTIIIQERLVKSRQDSCWAEYASQHTKKEYTELHSDIEDIACADGDGVDRLITKPEMGDPQANDLKEVITRKEMCAAIGSRKGARRLSISSPNSSRLIPDVISADRQVIIELQEVGGTMMSMWPRFLSKLNFGSPANGGEKPSCLIYVVDLTNPGQIPAATIELHNILVTHFPDLLAASHAQVSASCGDLERKQSPHHCSRLAIVANKITAVQHGTPEAITPSKILEIKKRLKSLLMLPCEACFLPCRHSLSTMSNSNRNGIYSCICDFDTNNEAIPIFVTDTWFGTGLGDVARWIETR
eukprot:Tbor_TRINITY_DN5285_c0_g1::TRINITY_DN5285_c0_g1_i1::g.16190::m.16190